MAHDGNLFGSWRRSSVESASDLGHFALRGFAVIMLQQTTESSLDFTSPMGNFRIVGWVASDKGTFPLPDAVSLRFRIPFHTAFQANSPLTSNSSRENIFPLLDLFHHFVGNPIIDATNQEFCLAAKRTLNPSRLTVVATGSRQEVPFKPR
jgi:hypothetical protein